MIKYIQNIRATHGRRYTVHERIDDGNINCETYAVIVNTGGGSAVTTAEVAIAAAAAVAFIGRNRCAVCHSLYKSMLNVHTAPSFPVPARISVLVCVRALCRSLVCLLYIFYFVHRTERMANTEYVHHSLFFSSSLLYASALVAS